jgi:hypothetical protein
MKAHGTRSFPHQATLIPAQSETIVEEYEELKLWWESIMGLYVWMFQTVNIMRTTMEQTGKYISS